jgi:hypothetical protein
MQSRVVVAELHVCAVNGKQVTSRRGEHHRHYELADQTPFEMRVAVDGAADCPWRARPRLEAGRAVCDGPANQPVDRHARIGANSPVIDARHLTAAKPEHDPADSLVGDQDVRAAPQRAHRDASAPSKRQDRARFVGVAHVDQPIGVPADLERRQRCERSVAMDPIGGNC